MEPKRKITDAPLRRRATFIRPLIAALLLAVSPSIARAFVPGTTPLPTSIQPVAESALGAMPDPHKPLITRRTLKPAEIAAPLTIEVALKMRNFSELEARAAHGDHISAKEMATRYEPLAANYDAVAAWLANEGLTVARRDPHHVAVFARGSISQIQQALGVTFARVAFEGKEYSSAITAPHVPSAFTPLLVGVNGLQPHLHAHKHILHRDALSGSASYFPKQIAQAYDATGLYTAGIQGAGQAIAIVIDTFPAAGDLEAFWKDAGISQSINNVQFIQAVPGTLASPSGEETLDTEWSSSMAPDVHVRVYAAVDLDDSDLDQAYQQVYDDVTAHPSLGIHQMSMSYGQGEAFSTLSEVQTDDQYFAELATAGVTVFASSGDDGSTPGSGGTGDENGPLNVDNPASDPNVFGVGGTTLVLDSSNNESSEVVWNENGGASGGGHSVFFPRPAWQTGQGVVSGTGREVPDVAAAADPDYGAVIVLGGVEQTVGGTSWSSPTWAALCSLLNEARANAGWASLGLLGPYLYPLIDSENYQSVFRGYIRDITSGNNATRVSGGDYSATAGYDLCTGLGAPLAASLAAWVTGSSALIGVQNPVAVEQVVPGQAASFTVTVTGTTATYQWQRMPIGTSSWSDLTDDGTYAGSTAATLTISSPTTAMSGDQFQCLVLIGTNSITTSPASVLIVDTPLSISTLAGRPGATGLTNGTGSGARFDYPSGVAIDGSGNVYVADFSNNQIREVTPGGTVTTPYGALDGGSGSGNGSGNSATFDTPNAVAIDGTGNIYVADTGNNLIRKITGGVVSTFAGTGGQFNSPEGIAVDGSGNVYVADSGNDVIRKITSGGTISTLAGKVGDAGFANGNATSTALFNNPSEVAVDGSGNVYVADFGNSVVRKISGGTVSTVAGQAGVSGYLDGLGPNTLFNAPTGVALDAANNLYITDALVPATNSTAAGNNLVRKLSPTGVVSTLAGDADVTGTDDGIGAAAQFYSVQAVAVAASGQVYLADTYNQTIRTGTGNSTIPVNRAISLSGDLDFGDVQISLTATNTLTISNTGDSVLTVTGISYPSGFSGNWSSGTISPGGSQDVTVTFAPISAIEYGGNIVVASDATSGSDSIAVSGSGVVTPTEPSVSTSAATNINSTSATLNGSVNPEGASTNVYLNYGLTGTYGSVSSSANAGVGTSVVPFSENIGGLLPGTVYHFQAVASNAAGTVYGDDETFETSLFSTVPLAATGDSATGVTGGEFASFGNPAINTPGYVAFHATLVNGAGGVNAADNSGIWADDASGSRYLVAETRGFAPGVSGAKFVTLSNVVYNDNQAVAFLGTINTPANTTGLWSSSSGSVELVARIGAQAPEYPSGITFTGFNAFALPDQGGVLLLATVSNGHRGIWAGDSVANLQLLVKEGDSISGETISDLSILPTRPYVSGQTRSFEQATGDFVYQATFTDHSSGIVEVTSTSAQFLEQSDNPAPGVTGGVFSAFSSVAMNASGYIAFAGLMDEGSGGVAPSDRGGIWADDNTGMLQLVARTGSAAPGTSAVFRSLGDPVYNDNEAVAFRGTLSDVAGGPAISGSGAGIWSNSGGSPALIAQQGGQAPGCPTGASFKLFNAFALPDQGGVIFLATLNTKAAAGVSSANNMGIWAVDGTGVLRLIVRKGDIVNGKTISSLSFLPIIAHVSGQTRNFGQGTGNLIYQATFSDKTSAISAVIFR
ncbi:MAG: choice-of-anchor tandem repeat NxxGxxAF-containing protein [Chthoniobacteraceae bacterium]